MVVLFLVNREFLEKKKMSYGMGLSRPMRSPGILYQKAVEFKKKNSHLFDDQYSNDPTNPFTKVRVTYYF